jgi:hypothetical protein
MRQRDLQWLWLKALLFALFGYALLGKGFAYLFLGEMTLVVGFFIFVKSQRIMLIFSDNILLLWAIFAFWGFCRTVPFLHKYGFDAVRDAVLWGYGGFALLIVAFVNNSNQISRALNTYRKFLRWYLPIVPFLILLTTAFQGILPTIPWSNDIPIIFVKGGDAAVQLAGAGLFLLLFPDRQRGLEKQGLSMIRMLSFVGWMITFLLITVGNRGGFVAVIGSIALASALNRRKIGRKVVAFAATGIILALLMLEVNPFTIRYKDRDVTTEQMTKVVRSIAGDDSAQGHGGTKQWRLIWWGNIIRYTVFGPYRWTGKGFGVNLALEDGPSGMTPEESSLRSPHNGNMTVLARMGVPGITLWSALNFVFAFRLLQAYRRANRSGSQFWGGTNLWILCFWFAAFINMSFDVYLEGPQGGVWFWSIIGLGVAALRVQAHEARQLLVQTANSESVPHHAQRLPVT